jgi:hypothetical protein
MSSPMIVRVFKSFGSRANKRWSNTYEFDVHGSFTPGPQAVPWVVSPLNLTAASAAVQAVVAFEKAIHLPNIQFVYATASTWVAEPETYDPSSLVSYPLTGAGVRVTAMPLEQEEGNVDLRTVVIARRFPTYGKLGKAEYRGCLDEVEVISAGGLWELNPDGDFAVHFAAAVSEHLAPVLGAAGAGDPRMVMINGSLVKTVQEYQSDGVTLTRFKREYVAPYHVRLVNTFTYGEIGVRALDNKYWDRP